MGEIGLDSRRHGTDAQARSLAWQLEAAFQGSCAGAFVFAWTDEWHVTFLDETGEGTGGAEIEDWDFGLTDRDRRPKPALASVAGAFAEAPIPSRIDLPRVSVVVCTHNGSSTLDDCLQGLSALDYPSYEVIVVDDGSTDDSAAIAGRYGVRVIRTGHQGLASARNTGLAAATGEIVAYIDDDACPDPDWLGFLAAAFVESSHAGIGGPNVEFPGDGPLATCVARAPGGPTHVLLSDTEAEHLPGCNSAFRKDALEEVGGFDTRFWAAGDDVDLCWRLHDAGWTLGFSPGAVVWHHARPSVRAYWRQQVGYGKAEALLERKWPERYNLGGHLTWRGRVYRGGPWLSRLGGRRGQIYHGTWGTNLFQSLYQPRPGLLAALPSLPESYLLLAVLAAVSALGVVWWPLLLLLPLVAVALGARLAHALLAATRTLPARARRARWARAKCLGTLALLHLLQPLARLWGRLRSGLTPWRRHGRAGMSVPWPRRRTIWSERERRPEEWLGRVETSLRRGGASVVRGGCYDSWDLEVRGGPIGAVRVRALVEEHGMGRQLVRLRTWPRWQKPGLLLGSLLALAAVALALEASWHLFLLPVALATVFAVRGIQECAGATGEVLRALDERPGTALPAAIALERATTIRS
jgi:GT2 family glycosyltransferase